MVAAIVGRAAVRRCPRARAATHAVLGSGGRTWRCAHQSEALRARVEAECSLLKPSLTSYLSLPVPAAKALSFGTLHRGGGGGATRAQVSRQPQRWSFPALVQKPALTRVLHFDRRDAVVRGAAGGAAHAPIGPPLAQCCSKCRSFLLFLFCSNLQNGAVVRGAEQEALRTPTQDLHLQQQKLQTTHLTAFWCAHPQTRRCRSRSCRRRCACPRRT